MRSGLAGRGALVAAALLGSSGARAQAAWFPAAQAGGAAMISGGHLPTLGLGLSGGLDVVRAGHVTVRTSLVGMTPITYSADKVCVGPTPDGCGPG